MPPFDYVAPAEPPISIDDLLSALEVLQKKEFDDKILLQSVANMDRELLKTKLLDWALLSFPDFYEIYKVSIVCPPRCSDGITRNLAEYISFCCGQTMQDLVAKLQEKLVGISVTFANTQTHISILVSRTL